MTLTSPSPRPTFLLTDMALSTNSWLGLEFLAGPGYLQFTVTVRKWLGEFQKPPGSFAHRHNSALARSMWVCLNANQQEPSEVSRSMGADVSVYVCMYVVCMYVSSVYLCIKSPCQRQLSSANKPINGKKGKEKASAGWEKGKYVDRICVIDEDNAIQRNANERISIERNANQPIQS